MITIERTQASRDRELARLRAPAFAEVRNRIALARAAYITDLPGQEMIYTAKEAEAVRFLGADPQPNDLTEYPLLAAEVGVTAPTASDLADLWIAMSSQWRSVAAQMERVRMSAKAAIDAATTQDEIDASLAAFRADLAAA